MKVLILGGSGFLGYHLAQALEARKIRPHILDRTPPLFEHAAFTAADLGAPLEPALFSGVDVVYHLAWTTLPKSSNDNPVADVTTNLPMSLNILDACVRSSVGKIIFISSGGTVYGIPETLPIREDHPTNPICSYGITKLMVEKYLHLYRHLYGLEYIVLRPANPFGEYQDPFGMQGAVAAFLGHLAKKTPVTVWGDGSTRRDFLYAGDLADAMVRCLDYDPADAAGRVLNVGSGAGMSLNELLGMISRVTGIAAEVRYDKARRLDVPSNELDISLARERLGWNPVQDIGEAVRRTWQWIRSSVS